MAITDPSSSEALPETCEAHPTLQILHHDTSTEISPELMAKLEKKARHKNVDPVSLVFAAIEEFVQPIVHGTYPSGDND